MKFYFTCFAGLFFTTCLFSATVDMTLTDANQTPLGKVSFHDSPYGLLITPHLINLPPGMHGFHIHEHANCADRGMNAGGHYDPHHTQSHLGPYANGHLGDLPSLYVNTQGEASVPILAPRLKVSDLSHVAVMIHQGADTYSNEPPLGGGGTRLACGVIE